MKIDVTTKTSRTPVQYIWYPAESIFGTALNEMSTRFGLARLSCPLDARRGPALLLYPLPEHCIYQAFLQNQTPDEALAIWATQASNILQALREGGPQVSASELSQFLLFPGKIISYSSLSAADARATAPVPVPPAASDPVLLALAAACLQQNKTVLSLAKELQQAALIAAPPSPPPRTRLLPHRPT